MAFPQLHNATNTLEPPESIIATLENIARLCTDRTNKLQHIPELQDYIAKDWRGYLDNFPPCISFDEYWDIHLRIHGENGGICRLELLDVTTDMDLSRQRAEVFLFLMVHDRPPGVHRESLVIMKWKVVRNRWQWHIAESIRSGGDQSDRQAVDVTAEVKLYSEHGRS